MVGSISKRLKNHARVVKFAGWSFILLALFYPVLLLSFSIENGGYGLTDSVADALDSFGHSGVMDNIFWVFLSLIPLLLITAALGVFSALKPEFPRLSGLVLILWSLSSLCFVVGIARWYVLYYSIYTVMHTGAEGGYTMTENMTYALAGLDNLLGFWVGQIAAEMFLYFGLLMLGYCLYLSRRFPVWLAYFAFAVAIFGFVGMGRHSSGIGQFFFEAQFVASIVPLFFIAMGVGLLVFRGQAKQKVLSKHKKELRKKRAAEAQLKEEV